MFVIKTPNPNYDGITLGVKFENGAAVVEDENLRKVLVNDYGYLSESKDQPGEPKVAEVPKEDAAPPKAPKTRKAGTIASGK